MATPAPSVQIGGQLNYIGFEGDEVPRAAQPFYDRYGVNLSATYTSGGAEQVITKIRAGGPGRYDVGTANNRLIGDLATIDLIEPIDLSQVPNYQELFPEINDPTQTPWAWHNGELYAIPLIFGFGVSNYNADKVDPPSNWDELLGPAYSNRIGARFNQGTLINIGLHLGFSKDASTWTKDQLAQVVEWGKLMKANAKTIVGTYGDMADLLIRGDIDVGWVGWEKISVQGQKAGVNIRHFADSEFVGGFSDALVVFKGSSNATTAHAWINHMLSAEAMAIVAEDLGSLVPNPNAVEFMPEVVSDGLGMDVARERFASVEWPTNPRATATDPNIATLDDFSRALEDILGS